VKRPVDRAAKANTEETTTKAINTMAVSSPVIPLWSLNRGLLRLVNLLIRFFMVRFLLGK
jgi:hypothetical protein